MQEGWSNIKESGDFIKNLKNIDQIPQDTIMITAGVVGLYPTISHACLTVLRKVLDIRGNKKISTADLTKMTEFVLKNKLFEFNGKFKKQISGNAIGTKFTPPYERIFMDQAET